MNKFHFYEDSFLPFPFKFLLLVAFVVMRGTAIEEQSTSGMKGRKKVTEYAKVLDIMGNKIYGMLLNIKEGKGKKQALAFPELSSKI